jgi:hypothetical protein
MWGKKKPDTPQAAAPEPRNLQLNPTSKPAPASLEGTTKMNKDVMHPTGAIVARGVAVGSKPPCERRNLGQRRPVH